MSSKGLVLAGYAVRGTVRSRKSVDGLVAALSDYIKNGLLEIVEVPDITVSGAFDSSLEGVTDVAHLATPVSVTNTDVVGIYLAALQGTLSILDSTLRYAGIESFVFMSSVAAFISYSQPRTYTEADWHDESVEIVDEQGAAAGGLMVYTASKVKAERVFWSWIESKKPSFRAVALCPVVIVGGRTAFGVPQAVADILQEAYPDRKHIIKEGTPGQGYSPTGESVASWADLDSSKAVKATGQDWISYKKMVLHAAKMFEGFL
ncbi:putative Dihydroflavonol 4-reductase [Seiridium cardinale]|uniref:Dihydroflavonol 4-reductase n=1 Tax=Seiridium cardinale TaxID=138064 RepID=A0ABR2XQP9_9PEZI